MAIDRISDFVLSGISDRFPSPDIVTYNGIRDSVEIDAILERDYTTNVIEIPAFCFDNSVGNLKHMLLPENENPYVKIVNTILGSRWTTERKQVNTILKDFTLRNYDSRLAKVSNKGDIYYGFPGFVADNAFNTLICLKVRMTIGENFIRVTDYICYVSSKVFLHQDGIIEKTIYKKIIPFCSSYVLKNTFNWLKFLTDDFVKYDWEGKPIEVIIRNGDECLLKPNSPVITDFETDDLIKDILLKNIDSIL